MTETFFCDLCGTETPLSDLHESHDQRLCGECQENSTVCYECGERVFLDDNAGDDDTPLCPSCFEREYTYCEHCGILLRYSSAYYEESDEDEDYPLCYSCYERCSSERVIHDYGYKPDPLFCGAGPRYFGVELEIDGAGEYDRNAEKILEAANPGDKENLYCKHDGSLNEGFELVTHPMSLQYHLEEMPWRSVLDCARNMGYLSHKASTCGLHIHVSRAALGKSHDEQDEVIARILYFFEKNWEELLKFSRRTPEQLNRWAARYGYKDRPKDILDHAKKDHNIGRYACVNLENYDTIEFRIFRGTLKYNTLIATLQLVNHICDVAIVLHDEAMQNLCWTTFAAGCTEPELVQYLKERRLYVNEPVETEEEN